MEPLGLRFLNLNSISTSLGQITGLVGMVLFSINLILASRFKFLDKYFKGLDKVYRKHSKIGSISFSLLLFHPIFLVIKYIAISTREAALFFVPFINMPITWGIIALFIMIVVLGITFYIKIKYHIWKMSHKFMTLAFVFAVLHIIFISSDISRNSFLRYYILILAFTGLFMVTRKTFLEKFPLNKYKYNIKNVVKLNENVLEIEMEPINKKMAFKSGQFAFFSFKGEGVSSESHPFSISSSSNDNNLKITVKNLGDFTSLLGNLKIGDNVLIDGPYGDFSYKNANNKNQIWIAGGIGVTPFLSMMKGLESDYNVDFYYCVNEEKEAINLNEINEFMQKNPNFKFTLWDSVFKGYINSGSILNTGTEIHNKDIFLCGPKVFMESLKNQFIELKVDSEKIHYENFSF